MIRERRVEQQFFDARPIKPDLGVLGHKWALLILADIGFRKMDRFNLLLRSNPALTARVLSRRLKELEAVDIIRKLEQNRAVHWSLTDKGTDLLPAIIRLVAFGAKWNTSKIFQGKLPQKLSD